LFEGKEKLSKSLRKLSNTEVYSEKVAPKKSNFNLLEQYEMGSLLGEGASSVVRMLTRRSDGKLFALKTYKDLHSNTSGCLESFLLKQLNHPGIIKIEKAFKLKENVNSYPLKVDSPYTGVL